MRPAMLAIRAAVDRYTRISREPALPGEEAVQPERFCDELLESLFADGAIEPERFFAWATRRYGWPGLLHVLAGRRAFLLGRQAEAAEHARRAIGLDQLDLYAQRLAALATPEGARQLEATEAWLKDRFCPRPFEVLETRSDGSANTCCNAWMPAAIGNIEAASAEALWNSPAAQEIRRSVLDGDYRYCSRTFCPKIAARALPRRDEVTNAGHRAILAERRTVMPHRPRRLLLSHDRSCNLSCPSCRKEPILAGKAEQERLDRLAEEVLLPLMRDARTVKVTGSGDPFGSHHFRYLLKGLGRAGARRQARDPDQRPAPGRPRLGRSGAGGAGRQHLGVDRRRTRTHLRAAPPRRLARPPAPQPRLHRWPPPRDRFRYFQLDAVVQAANLDELAEIVALARELGADLVSFQRLRNWGTFSVAEFAALDVASPAHPRHEALRAMLTQPCFAGADIDLGNLRPSARG